MFILILLTTDNIGLLDVFRNPSNKKLGQFMVMSTIFFLFLRQKKRNVCKIFD